ncbi:hypothetical protein [Bradyrhizobium sp. 604_D8_N2_3]|uniref:hypothetical protein n=1 Tax=Bradyrhizobium sp. 604_D8_N2_3 TaxID=3240370 RepID=UPI003F2948A5
MEKNRRFTVEITPAVHRKLKVMCAMADIHMTETVRRLLEREVEQPSILKPKSTKQKQRSGAEAM